jgi:hypothetical protein
MCPTNTGHAATLPIPAMNVRRFIGHASCRFIVSLPWPRMHWNGYAVPVCTMHESNLARTAKRFQGHADLPAVCSVRGE